MIFKLDINRHINWQMLSAVIYKKLNDFLISKWRKELMEFIKSIKVIDEKLIIKTQKPIINSELKIYEDEILDIFKNSLLIFISCEYSDLKLIVR